MEQRKEGERSLFLLENGSHASIRYISSLKNLLFPRILSSYKNFYDINGFFLFDIFFDIVIDMFTSISLFVSELYNIHFSLCRFFLLNFFVYLCKYNVFTDRKFRRNQLSSTNQSYIPHKILVTYKENIWIKISNYINPNFSTISNPKLCINYLLNNSSPKQLTPVIALPSYQPPYQFHRRERIPRWFILAEGGLVELNQYRESFLWSFRDRSGEKLAKANLNWKCPLQCKRRRRKEGVGGGR